MFNCDAPGQMLKLRQPLTVALGLRLRPCRHFRLTLPLLWALGTSLSLLNEYILLYGQNMKTLR